ncbi:ABC transporter ATP-binding protein [Solidesulfovibrio carbinolicus]|jgi:branched-chain amino acid transport system ATP-binding protein|uniref:ABC transporter ATP-binding protein n=1 Tax=Solidesulfovibrio carbinolicus TaxID=296842 RepID=A0A4P6HNV9_9BACT|nr:ABC transporter ATP-binding protein [Solidesulfovibrio carbinolicus]
MALLEVEALCVNYGAVSAVRDVSLSVEQGEIVTLIGANGAGKTSILRAISKLVAPRSGVVRFDGRDVTSLPPEALVRLGMAHSPEGRQVLAKQSVGDNLELGAYVRKDRAEIAKDMARMYELFPRLSERRNQSAGTLSGGEQQMLAIARALMSRPRLLLLDEPSLGLAPLLVSEIFEIIMGLGAMGTTILLVEQNARLAMRAAARTYVVESGGIVLEGPSAELAADERVTKAYLG